MKDKGLIDAYQEISSAGESVIMQTVRSTLKGCCAGCAVPVGLFKAMQVAAGLRATESQTEVKHVVELLDDVLRPQPVLGIGERMFLFPVLDAGEPVGLGDSGHDWQGIVRMDFCWALTGRT